MGKYLLDIQKFVIKFMHLQSRIGLEIKFLPTKLIFLHQGSPCCTTLDQSDDYSTISNYVILYCSLTRNADPGGVDPDPAL